MRNRLLDNHINEVGERIDLHLKITGRSSSQGPSETTVVIAKPITPNRTVTPRLLS